MGKQGDGDRKKILEMDLFKDPPSSPPPPVVPKVQKKKKKKKKEPLETQSYGHVTFTLFMLMACSGLSLLKTLPQLYFAHRWNTHIRFKNFPDVEKAVGSHNDAFNISKCHDPENEKKVIESYESLIESGPRPTTYLVTAFIASVGIFLIITVFMFREYFRRHYGKPFDKTEYFHITAVIVSLYAILVFLIDLTDMGQWGATTGSAGICGHFGMDLEKCFSKIGACLDIEDLRLSHRCAMISCLSTMITFYFVRSTESGLYTARLLEKELKASKKSSSSCAIVSENKETNAIPAIQSK